MMKITSKDFEVTNPIRDRISSRLDKLSRHDIQLINPHIIITQEKQGFKIEANVGIPNNTLFAQATNDDLYAAINALGQKLEKQLNRVTHKAEGARRITQIYTDELTQTPNDEEIFEQEYVA
ncbi:ribosome-associated translation inhibitor RaiA [Shewanella sp. AS1]|uniref:ribosome hibernation-promoting factor, HPF/YfiA family n=1 Tax=Shewanella sp. AS1 TaxID=2907626 RepID=UPI001F409604|nr:ribosome-associated translation inhibitor RaiA [Shewanella sp. AS1]MCE9677984.1 ribosome-associated translation inhibitor RaiA [Shewanella sp. AS1]